LCKDCTCTGLWLSVFLYYFDILDKVEAYVMKSANQEVISIPLVSEENYRRFLNLGLVGLCATMLLLASNWLIYPQYFTALLSNSIFTAYNYENLLNFINGLSPLISILTGLGFFEWTERRISIHPLVRRIRIQSSCNVVFQYWGCSILGYRC